MQCSDPMKPMAAFATQNRTIGKHMHSTLETMEARRVKPQSAHNMPSIGRGVGKAATTRATTCAHTGAAPELRSLAVPLRAHQRLGRSLAPMALCLALALAPSLQPPAVAQSLPSLGEIDGFTVGQERRIGDQIAQQLYRDSDYLDDPVIQEYVDSIWDALLGAARANGALGDTLDEQFAWKVLVSRSNVVNAFALPGGYFGLYLGLVNTVGSKDELASVMAHEISHVTQRHISRMVAQNARQTPIIIASMILGALAASKNPDAGQAVMIGGHALATQNYLDFSRGMEQEADRVGLGLMAPAKFDPRGFVLMFNKLYQVNRLNDSGAYPYLRTHPLTSQRISDIQARIPDNRSDNQGIALTPEHALIVARSRVLSRTDLTMLRTSMEQAGRVSAALGSASTASAAQLGDLYAGAFAAEQLREFDAAHQWAQQLLRVSAFDAKAHRLALLLNAQIALSAGKDAWIASAVGALDSNVKERPELLLRAQAALRGQGAAASVIDQLQTWLVDHPSDALAWQAQSQLWEQQQQPVRAIRAQAEVQVARLDYGGAIDRFKAGLDMVRKQGTQADHVDASILTSRLQAVEQLQREREKDQ